MTEAELKRLEFYADSSSSADHAITGLIAEVRRLREALSEFGEHQCVLPRGCPKWAKPLDRDAVCTCGFDAALAGED